MPLITLDIPQHKMPIVKEFIQVIGLREQNQSNLSQAYYTQSPNSRQSLPNSNYSSAKGWEFFSNELEYE